MCVIRLLPTAIGEECTGRNGVNQKWEVARRKRRTIRLRDSYTKDEEVLLFIIFE